MPPLDQSVVPAQSPARTRVGLIGGLTAAGVIAFKLLKGAGIAKLAFFGAALWSIALVRPLPFAIAVIYAIVVHETGHILAMKRRGLKTSGIWFIPFVGAVAVAKQPFRSEGETYFVAVAGPIFGLLSVVSLVAAQLLLSRTNADAAAWLAYASAAAFINSFNLLPIGALDGGRIVKSLALSLSPRLGLAVVGGGFLLCAGLLAWRGSYVLAVLLLFSVFELLRWRKGDLLPPMSRKGVAGGLALYLFLFVLFPLLGFVAAAASNHLLTNRPAAIAELDPTLSTVPDVGCSQEEELRSVASTDPTEIMFTNYSTVKLSVYWLNSEGRRSFYAALSPGKSMVQRSYASHPWLIASSPAGNCLAIIRASSSPGTVVIRSTAE